MTRAATAVPALSTRSRPAAALASVAAMRVLGLDLGSKRIGLALSDSEGRIAFPEGSLARRGDPDDLAALRALVVERGVERIVVGLPIHMNGRRGPEAEAAAAFAQELAQATGLPVDLLDERWTSREAERALRDSGRGRRREPGRVDAVAATILLRTFLARLEGEAARGAADPDREDGRAARSPGAETE